MAVAIAAGVVPQRATIVTGQPRLPVEADDDPVPRRHRRSPGVGRRPEFEPAERIDAVPRRRELPVTEVGIGRLECGQDTRQGPKSFGQIHRVSAYRQMDAIRG